MAWGSDIVFMVINFPDGLTLFFHHGARRSSCTDVFGIGTAGVNWPVSQKLACVFGQRSWRATGDAMFGIWRG